MQYDIKKIRNLLVEEIRMCSQFPVTLQGNKNQIEQILFERLRKEGKVFALPEDILKRIDFSNISFKQFRAEGVCFDEFYGIILDPQQLYEKDLRGASLKGVTIRSNMKDPFANCKIRGTNFTGCKNAVIDPQTIFENDFSYTNLCDTTIQSKSTDAFQNSRLYITSFRGSKDAIIDPQTIFAKDLTGCQLGNVTIRSKDKDAFRGCVIRTTDFTGCEHVYINPQTIYHNDLHATILKGVTIRSGAKSPFASCDITGTDFTGCKNVVIDPQTISRKSLEFTILNGAVIKSTNRDAFAGCYLAHTNFEWCQHVVIDTTTAHLWYTILGDATLVKNATKETLKNSDISHCFWIDSFPTEEDCIVDELLKQDLRYRQLDTLSYDTPPALIGYDCHKNNLSSILEQLEQDDEVAFDVLMTETQALSKRR